MSILQFKPLVEVMDQYDVFLFDLWGVIIEGEEVYEGVTKTINEIISKKQVFFVSNAPRPSFYSFKRVASWGINAKPYMLMTSGEIARNWIMQKNLTNPAVIYHLGADRNSDILSDLDHEITNDITNANILLLTLFRDEGEDLSEFDELLKIAAGSKLDIICANPDTIIPNRGKSRYCSGYFAEKIEHYGGKVLYSGKPHQEIYNQIFEKIPSVPKNRVLMIGDTFETDIMGANKAGIDSALVMTGNANKFHNDKASINDKLHALTKAASEAGAIPTFVTNIGTIGF